MSNPSIISILNFILLVCITCVNILGIVSWLCPDRLLGLAKPEDKKSVPDPKYATQIKNITELVEYLFRYAIDQYVPGTTPKYSELELITLEDPGDTGGEAYKLKIRAQYSGASTRYYISLLNNLVICAEYNTYNKSLKLTKVQVTRDDRRYVALNDIFPHIGSKESIDFSSVWKIRSSISTIGRMMSNITPSDLWYGVDNVNAYAFDYIPHSTIMQIKSETQENKTWEE